MIDLADELDDPRIAWDVVWVPLYPGYDTVQDALDNTPLSPRQDLRVWYDGDLVLPEGLADDHGLNLAWDVYLVYEPGRSWHDPDPMTLGEADFWMHQIWDGPDDQVLSPSDFVDGVTERLPSCDVVGEL